MSPSDSGGFTFGKSSYLGFVAIGLVAMLTFLVVKYCSGSSHLRKAKEYFQAGNFNGALNEATAEVEKDPQSTEGWAMVGNASEALSEMNRGDFNVYMQHVCTALDAWGKSLSLFRNPNLATKKAVLENKTQDMVGPDGNQYGRCPNTTPEGTESQP